MSKKESVPNRQYTEEFKVEAVRLADSIGGNAAAKRLGVPQSTVTNWVRNRKTGRQRSAPVAAESTSAAKRLPVSELEAENARLRKELVNAKLDLEIVKNRLRGPPAAHMNRNRQSYTPNAFRTEAACFLEASSPSKNLAQGKLRAQLWWHFA